MIQNLIQSFRLQLKSELTSNAYGSDLKKFFDFNKIDDLNKIDNTIVISYKNHLETLGEADTTFNRRLSTLKSFFDWAVESGHMQKNPIPKLKLKKAVPVNPTVACSDAEAHMLINAPNIDTFYGNVHRITMTLLFNLGLRRAEVASLRFSNIKEEQGCKYIRVKGKRGKVREIPLTETLIKELEDYKTRYQQLTNKSLYDTDFIIQSEGLNKNSKPIHSSSIYRIVKEYADKCGIKDRITPHSCRATVLSQLLENGVSPRDVADFAGHSNINTTMIYDKKRKRFENSAAYKVNF